MTSVSALSAVGAFFYSLVGSPAPATSSAIRSSVFNLIDMKGLGYKVLFIVLVYAFWW